MSDEPSPFGKFVLHPSGVWAITEYDWCECGQRACAEGLTTCIMCAPPNP